MAHNPEFLKLVDTAKSQIKETTVEEVYRRQLQGDRFVFIDVREDDEWSETRASGAIHIGKGVLERDIETKIPDKGAEIILYCGGGFRSALAAESIQRMGYERVISMDGGIRAWKALGLPTQHG